MATVNRTIESDTDKEMAAALIKNRVPPFTLSLTDGRHRSTAQNRLQHMWMAEISQQKGDMTPEEVRAYCKLTIGVPLLRAENEAFRAGYDRVVRPLSYQQKMDIMSEPFDFGVTRLMTTKQKTQYLDDIARHFGEQGIILTMPEDIRKDLKSESSESTPRAPAEDGASQAPSTEAEQQDPPPLANGQTDGPASISSSQEAGSPLPKEFVFSAPDLVHLKDFARKALDDAASDEGEPTRLYAIDRLKLSYLDALESKDARQAIEAMDKALTAVAKSQRTRSLAADYIARDIIGCAAAELEGRK